MPYYTSSGQEIEDLEGDNMRREAALETMDSKRVRRLLKILSNEARYNVVKELYNPARENAITSSEMRILTGLEAHQWQYILRPLADLQVIEVSHGGGAGNEWQYFVNPNMPDKIRRLLEVLFGT